MTRKQARYRDRVLLKLTRIQSQKLFKKSESLILKPFMFHIKTLQKERPSSWASSDAIQASLTYILIKSDIMYQWRDIRLRGQSAKKFARSFLKVLNFYFKKLKKTKKARASGRKKRRPALYDPLKFHGLKIKSKRELLKYNSGQAQKKLAEYLKNFTVELAQEYAEHIDTSFRDLSAGLYRIVEKQLNRGLSGLLLIRAIEAGVKKVLKQTAKNIAKNDAYAQVNKGELAGGYASDLNTLKVWKTQFDSKTRNWHDRVNGQGVLVNDRFTVPYPGGVDYLSAPKQPPISGANYVNCRCFTEYEIIKK